MSEAKTGKVVKVAGPVVVAEGMAGTRMYDVVRVSEHNLIGEIVELHGDLASIQVYEETTGIGPGEPVVDTEAPLSVELGPGLIESIYDGIQRPLNTLVEAEGEFMSRGSAMPGLDLGYEALGPLFFVTPYYRVVDAGASYLGSNKSFLKIEQQCEEHLTGFLKSTVQITAGPQPIIAYLLLKENEIRTVRLLLTAKKNNLDTKLILDRLGK